MLKIIPNRETSQLAWIGLALSLGPLRFSVHHDASSSAGLGKDKALHQNTRGHGTSTEQVSHGTIPIKMSGEETFVGGFTGCIGTSLGGSPVDRRVEYLRRTGKPRSKR